MHILQKKSFQKATSFIVAFSIVISLMPHVAYATEIEEDNMPTEPTTYVVDESGDVVSAYVDTNTPDIINTESEFIDEKVDEADSICAAEEPPVTVPPQDSLENTPLTNLEEETPSDEIVEEKAEELEDSQLTELTEEQQSAEILLLETLLSLTGAKEFMELLLNKTNETTLNKLKKEDIEKLVKYIDENFIIDEKYQEAIDFIYKLENAPQKPEANRDNICSECGAHNSHIETCNQYIIIPENTPPMPSEEIPVENSEENITEDSQEDNPKQEEVSEEKETTETADEVIDKNDDIGEEDVSPDESVNDEMEEELIEEPSTEAPTDEELSEEVTEEKSICPVCGGETEEHLEECPTLINPVEKLVEQLLSAESLEAFWDIMMAEENKEYVYQFSVEEITLLMEYVNTLYDVIPEPTADDMDYRDMLLETFTYLPAMECPECGEFGGHLDECSHYIEILINDPKNGMTLTADHSIGAQTLNSGSTVTWTIPEGITLTITGTILLQKNTTLVITGGGTVLRKIDNTLFDIEDTCTLNLNDITVTGDGQSFQYPVAQTTADDKVSNIIINNTTIKNMTIARCSAVRQVLF